MTSDAILVVQCLFSTIWTLFTSWYIPGTNVTPAQFFLFLGSASLGITFIVRLLTVNPGISSHSISNFEQNYNEHVSLNKYLLTYLRSDDKK